MGSIKKNILIGFLVSIFATSAGLFLYLQYFSRFGFQETLKMVLEGGVLGPVIALATIPNLFVFFIFLKKNQIYKARGVLMGVILIALFTMILKFR